MFQFTWQFYFKSSLTAVTLLKPQWSVGAKKNPKHSPPNHNVQRNGIIKSRFIKTTETLFKVCQFNSPGTVLYSGCLFSMEHCVWVSQLKHPRLFVTRPQNKDQREEKNHHDVTAWCKQLFSLSTALASLIKPFNRRVVAIPFVLEGAAKTRIILLRPRHTTNLKRTNIWKRQKQYRFFKYWLNKVSRPPRYLPLSTALLLEFFKPPSPSGN
jgi:hypothetical protein